MTTITNQKTNEELYQELWELIVKRERTRQEWLDGSADIESLNRQWLDIEALADRMGWGDYQIDKLTKDAQEMVTKEIQAERNEPLLYDPRDDWKTLSETPQDAFDWAAHEDDMTRESGNFDGDFFEPPSDDCYTFSMSVMAEPNEDIEPTFPDVLSDSGLLETIAVEYESSSKKTSDEVNCCVALTSLAAIVSRSVCDDSAFSTPANLYNVMIGNSGSGKDAPRRFINRLVHEVRPSVSGPNSITSSAALCETLRDQPSQLFVIDEIADDLAQWMNPKAAGFQADIMKVMKLLYTSAWDEKVQPRKIKSSLGKSGKDMNDYTMVQPHLSIYWACTRAEFFHAIPAVRQTDGTLGRFTLWELNPTRKKRATHARSFSSGLIGCLKPLAALSGDNPFDGEQDYRVTPKVARRTPEAIERLEGHYEAIEDRCEAEGESGQDFRSAIWMRASEKTARFALLFAISRSRKLDCEITLEDADRAISLSNFLIRRFLLLADELFASSQDVEDMKTVISKMPAKGKKIQRAKLLKASKWKSWQFDNVIKTLTERGDIEEVKEGRTKFYICKLNKAERSSAFGVA